MMDDYLCPPIIMIGPTSVRYVCGHHWRGMGRMPRVCPVCDKTIEGECTDAGVVRLLAAPRKAPKAKGKKGERP